MKIRTNKQSLLFKYDYLVHDLMNNSKFILQPLGTCVFCFSYNSLTITC